MPSLRTIFFAAAAGLACFTSAAPLGAVPDVSQLSNLPAVGRRGSPVDMIFGSASGAQSGAGAASGAGASPLGAFTGAVAAAESSAGSASGAAGGVGPRGAKPDSLPVVLNRLVGKLEALLAKLTHECGSKTDVEPSLLKPILEELNMILGEALAAVKLLVGLPLDVILRLAGKILAAIDIAHILCTVLGLVCSILLLVIKVLGPAGALVVAPLIQAIAALVVDLLTVILGLVSGLLPCLVPLLGAIVSELIALKLWPILDCLKIAH